MYNILGEVCSLLIGFTFFIFIISSYYLKEKRNLLFLMCSICIIFTAGSDILSCWGIENYRTVDPVLNEIISFCYFLGLGVLPFAFCLYFYATITSDKKLSWKFHGLLMSLFAVYLAVIILNFWTGWVFSFDPQIGYVRGPLKNITYVITGTMILLLEITVIRYRKTLSPRMFIVLVLYPIVSAFITMIQFFNEYWLMTGCSGSIVLILMYIAIQSDKIEIDYKTGLYTEQHLARTLKRKANNCKISLVSIENLEVIADKYGQTVLARVLYNLVRSFRLNIHGNYYRYGAKFILVSDKGSLADFEDEIFKAFERYNKNLAKEGTGINLDFLAATVCMPEDVDDYDEALVILNELSSRARSNGHTVLIHSDDEFMNSYKREKQILQILERELTFDSKQFQIFYQPIYSIKTGKFEYAEALSRLNNTELGNISPGEFIPIAEKHGLIGRLGMIVFEKVCDFISRNKELVNAVSVNFSVQQLTNPYITDFVLDTIRHNGIKPENIVIEITESTFIDDFEMICMRMEEIVKSKIVFYLDDFGTGFSNFANVIRLPFTTIKIDRSFVLMMEKDPQMYQFVRNLILTFKQAKRHILVEGVETKLQDDFVRRAGVDYIQGFLYSKPIPENEYIDVLKRQLLPR